MHQHLKPVDQSSSHFTDKFLAPTCSSDRITNNFVDVHMCRRRVRALVDTGAYYNCLNVDLAKRLHIKYGPIPDDMPVSLTSASGDDLPMYGTTTMNIIIGGYACPVDFVITGNLTVSCILGLQMLQAQQADVRLSDATLSLANGLTAVPLITRFSNANVLRTVHAITVDAGTELRFPVKINATYKLQPSIVEQLQSRYNSRIGVAKIYVEPKTRTTVCQIVNLTESPITIPARTALATIFPAQLLPSADFNEPAAKTNTVHHITETLGQVSHAQKLQTLTNNGFQFTAHHLTTDQFSQLVDLLYEYRHVFAKELHELPGLKDFEYDIQLKEGAQPARPRQYRYPPAQQKIIQSQLDEWEQAGIIKEGSPVWTHPIVLVKKKALKPGDPPKYRICLDLRKLNEHVVIHAHPIPTFQRIVESFQGHSPVYMSLMDAHAGYLQVNISPKSSKMLGIETDYKTYEMLRLPFGLSVSPMAYQRIMNKITADYLYRFCVSYIDDLLTYSQSFPDHLHHLRLVLTRLSDAGLRMRADKCIWAQHKLPYLGFILSGDGIEPDPKKLTLISEAQPPQNARMLKSFLGMTGFYRRFIRRYASLTEPFRPLLRKGARFVWTEVHQTAFDRLKIAMTSSPIVLAYPDWEKDFVLITDAAKNGSGFIICQRDDSKRLRVISYGGRQWNKHEQQMSASEMELASILYAIESNSQFFLSKRFTILTDHISHCYVRNLKFQHGKLYRWSLRLQNYVFDIQHIAGKVTPADYISRAVSFHDPNANDLEDDSGLVCAAVINCDGTDRLTDSDTCSTDRQRTPAPAMRHSRRQGCYNNIAMETPIELFSVLSSPYTSVGQNSQLGTDELRMGVVPPLQTTKQNPVANSENTGRPIAVNTSTTCHAGISQSRSADTSCGVHLLTTGQQDLNHDRPTINDNAQTGSNVVDGNSAERPTLPPRLCDSVPQLPLPQPLINENQNINNAHNTCGLQRYLTQLLASDFMEHQRQSDDLKPIFQWLDSGILPTNRKLAATLRGEIFQVDVNGILYRIYQPLKRNVNSVRPIVQQLVIPTDMRQEVLSITHDSMSHFRLEKMYETLRQSVYWPGLYKDIQTFLTKCEPCAKASQRPPNKVTLQHPDVTKPLETLVLDHLSMPTTSHPLTGQSVAYVLTMVDRATNFTVLCPVADTTARTTAIALLYHWIPLYGIPRFIHSDLGSAYTSKLMRELCLLFGINHIFAASQNHKFVSRAEGTHRLVITALRKVSVDASEWIKHLPGIQFAINSSVLTTVGLSPAALLYHRDLRTPLLAQLPVRPQTIDVTMSEMLDTMHTTDQLIEVNTRQSFATTDRSYNVKATVPNYKLGQRLLLYDEYVPSGQMRKLHRFYRPVVITECLPHWCYRVRDERTNRILPFKIHASRLKSLPVETHLNGDVRTSATTPVTVQPDMLSSSSSVPQTDRTQADTSPQPQQPQRRPKLPMSGRQPRQWYTIKSVTARKRRHRGAPYVYRVEWQDGSCSWLPARDITPAALSAYRQQHRQRRRHRP